MIFAFNHPSYLESFIIPLMILLHHFPRCFGEPNRVPNLELT